MKTTSFFLSKTRPHSRTTLGIIPIILMLVASLIFQGCKKEETDSTPPTPTPEMNISPKSAIVTPGGNKYVDYEFKNLDSLTVNGQRLPLSPEKGSIYLTDLVKDTTLVFRGYYTQIVGGDTKSSVVKFLQETVNITVGEMPSPPTISLVATPDTIEWGEKAIVNVETQNEWPYCYYISNLPGFHGTGGSYETPELMETTTFKVIAHYGISSNSEFEKTETITVFVRELPLKTQLLCANAWLPDSIWYKYKEDDEWAYYSPTQTVRYGWVFSFYPNGKVYQYHLPDYRLINPEGSDWYFVSEDEAYWPYEPKTIVTLTPNLFVYDLISTGEESIFVRVKNLPVTIPDSM